MSDPDSLPIARWRMWRAVLIGGVCGTAAREGLSLAFPAVAGIPYATLSINILGALLLGLLMESLIDSRGEGTRHPTAVLLLGTGFLGSFTTYSALAVDGATLFSAGDTAIGIGYLGTTIFVGALASWTGIAIGSAIRHRHSGAV